MSLTVTVKYVSLRMQAPVSLSLGKLKIWLHYYTRGLSMRTLFLPYVSILQVVPWLETADDVSAAVVKRPCRPIS
jgi:hypothetical protein